MYKRLSKNSERHSSFAVAQHYEKRKEGNSFQLLPGIAVQQYGQFFGLVIAWLRKKSLDDHIQDFASDVRKPIESVTQFMIGSRQEMISEAILNHTFMYHGYSPSVKHSENKSEKEQASEINRKYRHSKSSEYDVHFFRCS